MTKPTVTVEYESWNPSDGVTKSQVELTVMHHVLNMYELTLLSDKTSSIDEELKKETFFNAVKRAFPTVQEGEDFVELESLGTVMDLVNQWQWKSEQYMTLQQYLVGMQIPDDVSDSKFNQETKMAEFSPLHEKLESQIGTAKIQIAGAVSFVIVSSFILASAIWAVFGGPTWPSILYTIVSSAAGIFSMLGFIKKTRKLIKGK